MARAAFLVGLAVGLAIATVTAAIAATTPVEVRDAPHVKEWGGSAIDGWFAWEANSEAHPRVFKVDVKPDGGHRRRVALPGTSLAPA